MAVVNEKAAVHTFCFPIVGNGVFWLLIMITLTMSDMVSRGWLGFPGK